MATITRYGNNQTITGTASADVITGTGNGATILGGAGNDSISANTGSITIGGETTTTLNGGVGNNTLTGSKYAEIFQVGSGYDTITNYGVEDTIHVVSSGTPSISVSGDDIILTNVTKTTGTMKNVLIKGAAGKAVTIKNSSGNVTTATYGGETASGDTRTPLEVVKTFIAALDKTTKSGSAALDEAVKACSPFNSLQEVIDQMVSDCRAAGNSDTFLKNYCGINFSNSDTGAITGSDAGGSATKTAESVVPESVPVSKWTAPTYGSTSTFGALTVKWPTAGASGKDFTDQEKFVLKGLNSTWIKDSLALIQESTGLSFANASVKTINIILENEGTNGVPARTTTVNNNYWQCRTGAAGWARFSPTIISLAAKLHWMKFPAARLTPTALSKSARRTLKISRRIISRP